MNRRRALTSMNRVPLDPHLLVNRPMNGITTNLIDGSTDVGQFSSTPTLITFAPDPIDPTRQVFSHTQGTRSCYYGIRPWGTDTIDGITPIYQYNNARLEFSFYPLLLSAAQQFIVTTNDGYAGYVGLNMKIINGTLYYGLNNGTQFVGATMSISLNRWYHVKVEFRSHNDIDIYVYDDNNNLIVKRTATCPAGTGVMGMVFGSTSWSYLDGNKFKGYTKDIKFYKL